MICYVLSNKEGEIVQRGKCSSKEEIPQIDGLMVQIITEDDRRQPHCGPAPTYTNYRAMDYPTIGEQLDVLWKVLASVDSLKDHSDLAPMLQRIQAVKSKHPKKAS